VSTGAIEEFVQFAAGLRPDFRAKLRGASWKEIAELECLAESPLPTLFADLLRCMGHDDGGLCLGLDESLDITNLIEYYQEIRTEPGDWPCPAGYIVLAPRGGDHDISIGIAPHAQVMFTSGEHFMRPYADSLTNLLYRDAFATFGVEGQAHRAFIAGTDDQFRERHVLPAAVALAVQLGYHSEWYSDSVVSCLRSRDGAMMTVTQYAGTGLAVNVGARTRRELLRVWWSFRRVFELQLEEWS
jgi:hypothetical protein